MAIYQHKKDSDLEKRLQLLRRQIYGKNRDSLGKSREPEKQHADTTSSSELIRNDVNFLYQDLFRIGIIASLALGLQIVLFLLSRNQIINLNFF